jgi:hypothetical protein
MNASCLSMPDLYGSAASIYLAHFSVMLFGAAS